MLAAAPQPDEQQPAPDVADYKQVLDEQWRLTRELDVLLNGEEGAAQQASLADLVAQLRTVVRNTGKPVLPAPDVPPWEELDYSKMTRKEMAVYIGQQNFTVTALRKRIERMEVKVRNQRQALRQMSSAPDVSGLVVTLKSIEEWVMRYADPKHPVATVARKALAGYRKQGGE